MLIRLRKGQSTLEYALVIAAVVAALVMMQIYLKRGLAGRFKASADDVGEQFDPAAFSSEYTTTVDSESIESVSEGVTRSEITSDETNTSGSSGLEAWEDSEALTPESW